MNTAPKSEITIVIMALSLNAYSEPCLRFSDEENLEKKLNALAPIQADRDHVNSAIVRECKASEVREYIYQNSPLRNAVWRIRRKGVVLDKNPGGPL